jgi:hypothetical protein
MCLQFRGQKLTLHAGIDEMIRSHGFSHDRVFFLPYACYRVEPRAGVGAP